MEQSTRRKNLTPKQQTFCLCYALTNNVGLAEKQAGFCRGVGVKALRQNSHMILYINLLRADLKDEYIVQYLYCVMQYKLLVLLSKKQGDYRCAADIVLRIAKLREPMVNPNAPTNNEIKIVIGT